MWPAMEFQLGVTSWLEITETLCFSDTVQKKVKGQSARYGRYRIIYGGLEWACQ